MFLNKPKNDFYFKKRFFPTLFLGEMSTLWVCLRNRFNDADKFYTIFHWIKYELKLRVDNTESRDCGPGTKTFLEKKKSLEAVCT